MVLRGTYGEKVYGAFRMTREGVRWRFWRLFNDIYVSVFDRDLTQAFPPSAAWYESPPL